MNFNETESAIIKKLTDNAAGLQVPADSIVIGRLGEVPALPAPFIAVFTAPFAGKKYESGKVEGALDTAILCCAAADTADMQAHKFASVLLASRVLNLLSVVSKFELQRLDMFSISNDDAKTAIECYFWGVDYYEDLYEEDNEEQ